MSGESNDYANRRAGTAIIAASMNDSAFSRELNSDTLPSGAITLYVISGGVPPRVRKMRSTV